MILVAVAKEWTSVADFSALPNNSRYNVFESDVRMILQPYLPTSY